jgi:hypothetical protein
MAKITLQPSADSLGDSGNPVDRVADRSDDSMKCDHCREWLADHIQVLWGGEKLNICPGQREDLDTYQSSAAGCCGK